MSIDYEIIFYTYVFLTLQYAIIKIIHVIIHFKMIKESRYVGILDNFSWNNLKINVADIFRILKFKKLQMMGVVLIILNSKSMSWKSCSICGVWLSKTFL